ncbi:hypothetical protein H0H92_013191 [Tricholoma furcatifolium]|nr:hypothetical protein H0H92_013191 [Tricholoma furcatifolium]
METKLHLITSLVLFLSASIQQLLLFLFNSEISTVKRRTGKFMASTSSTSDISERFYPAALFKIWYEKWPNSRRHLHDMIRPYACNIVLEGSDRLITDPMLRVNTKDLTLSGIQQMLKPDKLVEKYTESAPFMFELMHTFSTSTSPNKYRRRQLQDERVGNVRGALEAF